MSFTFPLSFGWAPITTEIEGSALAYVDDYAGDGLGLLISQFREKPKLEAVLSAFSAGPQDLEDAVWQMLTERWLSTAVGDQLDGLGQIVNLPRQGWGDELYRILISARVLSIRSRGRWPDLFAILRAMGVDISKVEAREPSMAAIRIVVNEPFDGDLSPTDVLPFLTKPAGVRLTLEFLTGDLEGMFTLADGAPEASDDTGLGDSTGSDVGGILAGLLSTTETA